VHKKIIEADTRQEINDLLYPGCRKSLAAKRWQKDKERVTIKIIEGFPTGNIPEGEG